MEVIREVMPATFRNCAGLDVHQKTVWACARRIDEQGRVLKEIRCFGTMTGNLIELSDWLKERGVTHVAMESTGVLWKPVYNILEEHFEVWLCNARDMKNVPGRKTDVKDCDWIAQLMQCGLLKKSFVPPRPVRDLRDLTRSRACLEDDKTRVINRIHKVLEDANIKLGAVASNILGVSGRAMLWKIIGGEQDAEELASLAKQKLKHKKEKLREPLRGRISEHHRFMLRMLMEQVNALESAVKALDERIEQVMEVADAERAREEAQRQAGQSREPEGKPKEKPPLPFLAALALLVEVWGIQKRGAQNILAEIGTDMSQWATDRHLLSWAGSCPGNNMSAGKNRSGATRKGNNWLRRALAQAAWGASRAKASFFCARYKRLVKRRGKARTIVAVGNSILKAIYHMLKDHVEYADLGHAHYQGVNTAAYKRKLVKNLESLGYTVELTAKPAA
jgi:transposase